MCLLPSSMPSEPPQGSAEDHAGVWQQLPAGCQQRREGEHQEPATCLPQCGRGHPAGSSARVRNLEK